MIINSDNESLGHFYVRRNERIIYRISLQEKAAIDERLIWIYSKMKKLNCWGMSDWSYLIYNSSILLHYKYSFHSYSYLWWPINIQSILGRVLWFFCQWSRAMLGKAFFLSACIDISVCSFSFPFLLDPPVFILCCFCMSYKSFSVFALPLPRHHQLSLSQPTLPILLLVPQKPHSLWMVQPLQLLCKYLLVFQPATWRSCDRCQL